MFNYQANTGKENRAAAMTTDRTPITEKRLPLFSHLEEELTPKYPALPAKKKKGGGKWL